MAGMACPVCRTRDDYVTSGPVSRNGTRKDLRSNRSGRFAPDGHQWHSTLRYYARGDTIMGHQLRMHNEIHDWLTDLRGTEPELARLAGEAVLAVLDAGESLGPPLVVALESVLRPPDDPREALDLSYQRQLEALTKVRRGVADVATSRKRVELQASQLEQSAAKLARQRQVALDPGEEDLASDARTRGAGVQEQLSGLRRQ